MIGQLAKYGKPRRGWLGVNILEVTEDVAATLSLPAASGALVAGVTKGGPAEIGGLQPGDVVTAFNGHPIRAMHDLPRTVATSPIGETVQLDLIRRSKPMTLKVTVQEMAESDPDSSAAPALPQIQLPPLAGTILGLHLAVLDDSARQHYQVAKPVSGALVTAVDPGSPAAENHISPGDTILQMAQQPVATPGDAMQIFAAQKKAGRKVLLVLVAGPAGDLRYVTLAAE